MRSEAFIENVQIAVADGAATPVPIAAPRTIGYSTSLSRMVYWTGSAWRQLVNLDDISDSSLLISALGIGLITKTSTGPSVYASRTIVAGSPKITVANGNGASGNPAIDLGSVALTDLSDTAISSPTTDQVLRYNGLAWTNGPDASVSAGTGVTFFVDDTASDIATYATLNRSPENVAESTLSATANNGRTLIKAFASATAGLGGSQIDAGEWVFDIYGRVDIIGAGLSSIDVDVYKRTSGGVETLLFNVNSGTLSATTEIYTVATIQQAFAINATDRLVAKFFAKTTALINRTVTLVYGGSTHYSKFDTPLVIRHNDLAGLQGGTAGEYYHLTSAQAAIVAALPSVSQTAIQFKDEGSNLGTSGTVDTVDFTGTGVTATRASNTITVNVTSSDNFEAALVY